MERAMTRIEQVMNEIRSRIASRTYVPGVRLPSVRAQARAMAVSVSTVVEAYERLSAEGVISSRAGSGFYVTGPVAPLALTNLGPKLEREVDPLWVSRQSLESDATVLKPGCGWLPSSWMYTEGVRRALRTLARADNIELAEYATPLGHLQLRQFLSRRLAGIGIAAPPEQVLLTESGTQSIDLICRFLLEPGDAVLVDDPCYFNFNALLKAHRANVIGVPYTPTGPDVEQFRTAIHKHSPRLYITNSGPHNPTGATLSPVTAHQVLKLAEQSGMIIVEDDIWADFEVTPAPRLASFDGLSQVMQIGSFSKTISASLRCGYIAGKAEWIDGLTDLKIATSFGGGRLAGEVVLAAVTGSGYRKHMEAVRTRLGLERIALLARLETLGITPWLVPQAGIYVWCRLPDGRDAADIARNCLDAGVVLAPGNAFSPTQSAGDYLRFNVSQSTDDRVFEVLASALCKK